MSGLNRRFFAAVAAKRVDVDGRQHMLWPANEFPPPTEYDETFYQTGETEWEERFGRPMHYTVSELGYELALRIAGKRNKVIAQDNLFGSGVQRVVPTMADIRQIPELPY